MKILHYSLGLPPYRSGGLTKYATDLMKAQQSLGHKVILLWPGRMNLINNFTRINKLKIKDGIETYEIVNPLPVSLLNGITNVGAYTEAGSKSVYKYFLVKHGFDVIHVHTLMGIHKEFFEAAKELNINIVYTTHDYFGICPKVSLFNRNGICNYSNDFIFCEQCNRGALSLNKIRILQSPTYKLFKESRLLKLVRTSYKKKHSIDLLIEGPSHRNSDEEHIREYQKLRDYYNGIFNLIDVFHFNSSNTRRIFDKNIKISNGKIIPISHNGISDNRRLKIFGGKLKISYLAATERYKGFELIKRVLDDLFNEGYRNFELNIYSATDMISDYMNIKGGYTFDEIESVFQKTDLLVVPSVWNETFGFVALEGLSYGVPVLLTTKVGAKDIFENGKTAMITEPSYEQLKEKLRVILEDDNRHILRNINRNIVSSRIINLDYINHVNRVLELYLKKKEAM